MRHRSWNCGGDAVDGAGAPQQQPARDHACCWRTPSQTLTQRRQETQRACMLLYQPLPTSTNQTIEQLPNSQRLTNHNMRSCCGHTQQYWAGSLSARLTSLLGPSRRAQQPSGFVHLAMAPLGSKHPPHQYQLAPQQLLQACRHMAQPPPHEAVHNPYAHNYPITTTTTAITSVQHLIQRLSPAPQSSASVQRLSPAPLPAPDPAPGARHTCRGPCASCSRGAPPGAPQ
jgi:hypothetical protein